MHIVFIPYGKIEEVELMLADMRAQKHRLKITKGKQTKYVWIQSQVRVLPFGVYEYVCPKEDMDAVLHTLNFNNDRYNLGKLKRGFLRKMVKCEKIPEYKTDNQYLWIKGNVTIIPIGVRYDAEDLIDTTEGEYKGWKHEAI